MKIIKYLQLISFILVTTFLVGQPISTFIHIDQFGYKPNASKIAVLSNPQVGYNSTDSYTAPAMMELRDASTNAIVFSAAPSAWNNGATNAQSGDQGWWFDFSSYTNIGTYYVYDPTNIEQSADFEIKEDVYNEILKAAVRMYFYNRCNMAKAAPYAAANWVDNSTNFENALQDANCRYVFDASNASLEKDLTGGWFDAGDYNKYTTFANSAVQMLLSAYEDNPSVFADDWNIPESGNGIPDILDEIKWELDWLLKMCNADGSTIIKMGSIDYSENVSAPPSANTHQRYYGPTCSSASIVVAGMFARAAKIYNGLSGMNAFVTNLETEAEAAWNYVLPLINSGQLETNCDDGTIKAGDADRNVADQKEDALIAAIYLFDLTGTSTYNDYVIAHINDAGAIQNSFWDGIAIPLYDALLHYTTIAGADNNTKNTIINSITTVSGNNWNGFYGFSDNDLYRAYIPDWAYHWGSNLPKAGYGMLNLLLNKYNINSGSSASYELKAKEQVHYFHGVNPQGIVYLSNMYAYGGDRCINQIYHTWFADGTDWDNAITSLYGPAPGYIPGGPNASYNANTSLTPPYNQPRQKSYLDFNTSWPDNSWEISEPAIYSQAYYVRLVSNFASVGTPLGVEWYNPLWGTYKKGSNYLYWTTAIEINNDYFEIQRSGDGHNWHKIGTVESKYTTSYKNKYTFKDTEPLKGLNYYRLVQFDLNGDFEYSNIITIRNKSLSSFNLVPNPTSDVVDVQLSTNIENGIINIFDINGKKIFVRGIDSNSIKIDISHFSKGIYFVQIIDKEGVQKFDKLIKE